MSSLCARVEEPAHLFPEFDLPVADCVLTPAFIVDEEIASANIDHMIAHLNGQAARWRPHVKCLKSRWLVSLLKGRGVERWKAATLQEVRLLLDMGAADVLVSTPLRGSSLRELGRLAAANPAAQVSVLIEDELPLADLRRERIGAFVDVDTGLDRTGITPDPDAAARLIAAVIGSGVEFRGLHAYDGHLRNLQGEDVQDALALTVHLLSALCRVSSARPPEISTGGTFALQRAQLTLSEITELHTVGHGTVILGEGQSAGFLQECGFQVAARVLTTVVSVRSQQRLICDAGSLAISTDVGDPAADVAGQPDSRVGHPFQEHLPITLASAGQLPEAGTSLQLVPRHVDTTLAQYDEMIVLRRQMCRIEAVEARGRGTVLMPAISRSAVSLRSEDDD